MSEEIEKLVDELFDPKKNIKPKPLSEEQIVDMTVVETIKELVEPETPIIDQKIKTVTKDLEPKIVKEKKETLDTIQEQIEKPMTTIHCPQSINEDEIKKVSKNPENYIEINIIKKIRLVDAFYISANLKKFRYKETTYEIIEEQIYILPTKGNFFMPTSFYYEGTDNPISFKQTNTGITGKAMSLLYNENLYMDLFSGDISKYNLFIVLLLIISISAFLIGLYFSLGGTI